MAATLAKRAKARFAKPNGGLARCGAKRRGFSLVELLVVIMIVAVAMAATIPRIGAVTNQTKVQRANQALQQDVQQAWAIASRNRAPVTLKFVSSSMQLQITNLTGSTIYKRTGYGTGGGYGLTSTELKMAPTSITVFPNGLANDTVGFSVIRSSYSRRFWVSKSGMVLPR
jgi:prepilin-type N-terminal cleavage/methylation domain-containing protein